MSATNFSSRKLPSSNGNIVDSRLLIVESVACSEGVAILAGNLVILMAIMRSKTMWRRESIPLAALALADLSYGLGYIWQRGRFFDMYIKGTLDDGLYTPWECMLIPHTFLFLFAEVAMALTAFAISIDRLVAVAFYQFYFKVTCTHSLLVFGFVFFCAALSGGAAFICSYLYMPPDATVPKVCYSTLAIPRQYGSYHNILCSCAGLAAILMYVGVMVVYKLRITVTVSELQSMQYKRQRQLTIVLCYVALASFVFWVFPQWLFLVISFLNINTDFFDTLASYIWLFTAANSINNLFIYMWKHRDMRRAIFELFTCASTKVDHFGGARSTTNM